MNKKMKGLLFGLVFACFAGLPLLAQEETEAPVPTEEVTQVVVSTNAPVLTPVATATSVPTGPLENYPGELDPEQTPTPFDILNSIYIALLAALAPVASSPIVSALVQVLKNAKIKLLENVDPKVLNLAISLAVVVLVFAANVAGFRTQLDTAFQAIVALVGITLTARGSTAWYHGPAAGIPLIGTEKKADDIRG